MKLRKRPILKLKLKRIDHILDVLSLAFLITLWTYTLINLHFVYENNPTHYNFQGQIDQFDNHKDNWTLPIISTLIFISIFVLTKFPHIYNYPVDITAENAEENYSSSTTSLRALNCICVLIFLLIIYATDSNNDINLLIAPLLLSLFILPILTLAFFKNK